MPLEAEAPPPRRRGDPAFAIRLWSALVLAPVALASAWLGGIAFGLVVAVATSLMCFEWTHMSDREAPRWVWVAQAVFVAVAILLGAGGQFGFALAVLVAGAVAGGIERARRGKIWRAAFGALYIGLPFLALIWLREAPERGVAALFVLFAMVWAADIGAYISGAWLGGPKLAPRVSPNKTWTGLIAGVAVGAVAGAAGFAVVGGTPVFGAAAGLLVSLSAMGGDLFESVLKRHFGVKDAGSIIPGHGGVLDRVDALMGAVLMFAALVSFIPAARAGFFGG